MADHRLDRVLDLFTAGPVAGESLEEFRRKIKSLGVELAALITGQTIITPPTMGAGETHIRTWVAPYALEITAIYGIKTTSADTITATMTADGNNPLTGANIDMHALVADTPTSQTLSATAANKLMNAGDLLKCTFASGGAGALTGGAVVVLYKPIQPF